MSAQSREMRAIVTDMVDAIEAPLLAERRTASDDARTSEAHQRWLDAWPSLRTLEVRKNAPGEPSADAIVACAWNIERCFDVEGAAALMNQRGGDTLLATEMDHGMAQSGQRHTTRDLADALGGWSYAFGVEFVERARRQPGAGVGPTRGQRRRDA